jgi:hypothetical protein
MRSLAPRSLSLLLRCCTERFSTIPFTIMSIQLATNCEQDRLVCVGPWWDYYAGWLPRCIGSSD